MLDDQADQADPAYRAPGFYNHAERLRERLVESLGDDFLTNADAELIGKAKALLIADHRSQLIHDIDEIDAELVALGREFGEDAEPADDARPPSRQLRNDEAIERGNVLAALYSDLGGEDLDRAVGVNALGGSVADLAEHDEPPRNKPRLERQKARTELPRKVKRQEQPLLFRDVAPRMLDPTGAVLPVDNSPPASLRSNRGSELNEEADPLAALFAGMRGDFDAALAEVPEGSLRRASGEDLGLAEDLSSEAIPKPREKDPNRSPPTWMKGGNRLANRNGEELIRALNARIGPEVSEKEAEASIFGEEKDADVYRRTSLDEDIETQALGPDFSIEDLIASLSSADESAKPAASNGKNGAVSRLQRPSPRVPWQQTPKTLGKRKGGPLPRRLPNDAALATATTTSPAAPDTVGLGAAMDNPKASVMDRRIKAAKDEEAGRRMQNLLHFSARLVDSILSTRYEQSLEALLGLYRLEQSGTSRKQILKAVRKDVASFEEPVTRDNLGRFDGLVDRMNFLAYYGHNAGPHADLVKGMTDTWKYLKREVAAFKGVADRKPSDDDVATAMTILFPKQATTTRPKSG
jgi:hypothetical protein